MVDAMNLEEGRARHQAVIIDRVTESVRRHNALFVYLVIEDTGVEGLNHPEFCTLDRDLAQKYVDTKLAFEAVAGQRTAADFEPYKIVNMKVVMDQAEPPQANWVAHVD